jgi:hypothetical protein
MNDLQLIRKFLLSSLFVFSISCQSSKQDKDPMLLMAEQVAEQLDVITKALDSAKDYKTAHEAGETIDLAGAEIIKIYHRNQGLKANKTTIEQVTLTLKKSSNLMEEARMNAEERFKDDVPPNLKIITAINRLKENMKLADDPSYRGPLNSEEPSKKAK